jgi:hypothetical protein
MEEKISWEKQEKVGLNKIEDVFGSKVQYHEEEIENLNNRIDILE